MNRVTAQHVLDGLAAPGWQFWLEPAQASFLVHVEQRVPDTADATTTWCHDELFWLHTCATPDELRRRIVAGMLTRTVHEFLHHVTYLGRPIFDQHRAPATVAITRRVAPTLLP